jgi:hypothetical protein
MCYPSLARTVSVISNTVRSYFPAYGVKYYSLAIVEPTKRHPEILGTIEAIVGTSSLS